MCKRKIFETTTYIPLLVEDSWNMMHLSPSPGFRLRSIVVTRIIFFWPWPKNPKNWISFRENNVLLRHHHQNSNHQSFHLWLMIHEYSWSKPFRNHFPPFPPFFPQKNSHLSTTLAACCPPPKRFTSENTVGQHTTLQIATFWGWLAIYFHYMVYIPISEMVHYKSTQTKKLH